MTGEIRQQILADLDTIIKGEFGQSIRISRQDGSDPNDFTGYSNDIHNTIDPQTGLMVSGRSARATLVLQDILNQFGELPKKLWIVEFLEISPNVFKIHDVMPDASMGTLTLIIGD
jgi:hypothetical protein